MTRLHLLDSATFNAAIAESLAICLAWFYDLFLHVIVDMHSHCVFAFLIISNHTNCQLV